MQITIEPRVLPDGSEIHDLVLKQGDQVIKLAITADNPEAVLGELQVWMDDNTMDIVSVLRGQPDGRVDISRGMMLTDRNNGTDGAYGPDSMR